MSEAGQKDPRKWIRRQAELVVSLGAIMGGFSAVILFFGGSFPPWYTPAEAQEAQNKSAVIQQQTVTTLDRINDKLDRLAKRVDQGECDKLRGTLERASIALNDHPTDPLARDLRDGTLSRMREIQGCGP